MSIEPITKILHRDGTLVAFASIRMRDGSLSEPELFVIRNDVYYPISRVFSGPGLPVTSIQEQPFSGE